MTNRPDPWIGKTLAGRYVVHAAIAEGGMGRVYRGVQRTLERPVAIKRMLPHLATAPGVVSRCMGEARLVSRLSHPNIVKVFDFGRLPAEDGGDLFLVMELLGRRSCAPHTAAPNSQNPLGSPDVSRDVRCTSVSPGPRHELGASTSKPDGAGLKLAEPAMEARDLGVPREAL
jgi:hypothetical protein